MWQSLVTASQVTVLPRAVTINACSPPEPRRPRQSFQRLPTPLRSSASNHVVALRSGNGKVKAKGGKGMSSFLDVEFKVRDYELDQYGVVNNAVYSYYCQHAFYELLDRIGISSEAIGRTGDALAITEVSTKYVAPLRRGEKFVVRIRVSDSSTARLFVQLLIYKLPNMEPIVEAMATTVWLDENYRPARIPADIRTKLIQFTPHETSN